MSEDYFRENGIIQYYLNINNPKKQKYYDYIFRNEFNMTLYKSEKISTLFIGFESLNNIKNYNYKQKKIFIFLDQSDENSNINAYKKYIYKIYTSSQKIVELANNNNILCEIIEIEDFNFNNNKLKNKKYYNTKEILYMTKQYPTLFNKYLLNLRSPDTKLKYKIINENSIDNNHICHLHILNIEKFNEIYGEFINDIADNYSIVITYSYGDITFDIKQYTIINIPNKGLDIGGKICMLDYIYKKSIKFEYILFLHSKSNKEKREEYFHPLIKNSERIKLIKKLFEMNKNLFGIFPNSPFYDINGKKNYIKDYAYKYDQSYYNEILNYLGCENNEKIFVEGNCLILKKCVIDYVFLGNITYFYNLLNEDNSFDYNWMKIFYKDKSNENELYNKYLQNQMHGNNINISGTEKSLPDGMIEHVFERMWINVIKHLNGNYILLDKSNIIDFLKIKINAIYFPQFHEIEENNQFWGNGFTEWTLLEPYKKSISVQIDEKTNENLQILKPHNDIGYYDLSNIDTMKKQIKIANEYNISGFIIYHYWFNKNKILMQKPLEYFLNNDLNINFCISWANETWSKRWDGSDKEVLIKQEYSENEYIEHINYLMQFFKKDNYIKNDDSECIFYIYNISDIPDFYNMERTWKDELEKHNLKIKIIITENSFRQNHNWNTQNEKFIFEPMYSTNYCYNNLSNKETTQSNFDFDYYIKENIDVAEHFNNDHEKIFEHYINFGKKEKRKMRLLENEQYVRYDYDDIIKKYKNNEYNTGLKHLGLPLYWNNAIRRKNLRFLLVSNFNKSKLYDMLMTLVCMIVLRYTNIYDFSEQKYENFINVNAWNEWNEQAVLEPNNIYGYDNLEIIYEITQNM
jgi:Glycosyltransferase WbsX